jgi:hypothetical protein
MALPDTRLSQWPRWPRGSRTSSARIVKVLTDPWDFPEPTPGEARAARERMLRQLDQIAERMRSQPDWKEPTPKQKKEAICALAELCESMEAEKAKVRAFTAKIERERAARAAKAANCS